MRYFTVKEGALVTRLGTNTYLGATVGIEQTGRNKGQTKITWTPGEVFALSDEELQQYGREYGQLLAEGSLVDSTEAAYKAYAEREAAASGGQADKAAVEAQLATAQEAQRAAAAEAEAAVAKAERAKADADRLAKELETRAAAEWKDPIAPPGAAPTAPTMQQEAQAADARGRTPEAAEQLAKQTAVGQQNPKAHAARSKE